MTQFQPSYLASIRKSTQGKDGLVFVAYQFNSSFPYYVVKSASDKVNLACFRASDINASGHDLRSKILDLIARADVVIADLSQPNPNVYYELGYATALGKQCILTLDTTTNPPTDLRGLEYIPYTILGDGLQMLEASLINHLKDLGPSEVPLLRDMLQAEIPEPCYIVAQPKYPEPQSEFPGHAEEVRTYGDYLGVRGLLAAFGAMYGEAGRIELVSPHADLQLSRGNCNLYLIGSRKVNRFTEELMAQIQTYAPVRWEFAPPVEIAEEGNWPVVLYSIKNNDRQSLDSDKSADQKYHRKDTGIIIRAPHPLNNKRMVMILAGAHSLGTGAACIATTSPSKIREIRDELKRTEQDADLADKQLAFWVRVEGEVNETDGHLDPEKVKIVDTGIYPR